MNLLKEFPSNEIIVSIRGIESVKFDRKEGNTQVYYDLNNPIIEKSILFPIQDRNFKPG